MPRSPTPRRISRGRHRFDLLGGGVPPPPPAPYLCTLVCATWPDHSVFVPGSALQQRKSKRQGKAALSMPNSEAVWTILHLMCARSAHPLLKSRGNLVCCIAFVRMLSYILLIEFFRHRPREDIRKVIQHFSGLSKFQLFKN